MAEDVVKSSKIDKEVPLTVEEDKKYSETKAEQEKKDVTQERVSDEIETKVKFLEEEVQTLKQQLQEKEKNIEELKNENLRLKAEFSNYRVRIENLALKRAKDESKKIILSFLQLYDSFGRAISHIEEENSIENVKNGIKAVFEQFKAIIKNLGIEEINAVGTQFDPLYHEVFMVVEDEKHPPNTVVEEFEKGFKWNDEVIKPSRVKVAKAPTKKNKSNAN